MRVLRKRNLKPQYRINAKSKRMECKVISKDINADKEIQSSDYTVSYSDIFRQILQRNAKHHIERRI